MGGPFLIRGYRSITAITLSPFIANTLDHKTDAHHQKNSPLKMRFTPVNDILPIDWHRCQDLMRCRLQRPEGWSAVSRVPCTPVHLHTCTWARQSHAPPLSLQWARCALSTAPSRNTTVQKTGRITPVGARRMPVGITRGRSNERRCLVQTRNTSCPGTLESGKSRLQSSSGSFSEVVWLRPLRRRSAFLNAANNLSLSSGLFTHPPLGPWTDHRLSRWRKSLIFISSWSITWGRPCILCPKMAASHGPTSATRGAQFPSCLHTVELTGLCLCAYNT